MKLDYECIRNVMKYLESVPYVITTNQGHIEYESVFINKIYEALPEHTQADIAYAILNLEQAGYLDISKEWFNGVMGECCVNFITFEGHEFLEKIKADTTWKKTLTIAGKVGNFGLHMLAKIAEGVATSYMNKQLLNL